MANFLGNLGAAFQGQQNYQTWETQQEQAKLRIEAEKENLAQIKEAATEAKEERKRKAKVAQGYLDVLSDLGQPGIPPPPPSAQPPAPGQASVPMVQPSAQYGQRPIGPPPQGPGAIPPMPPGARPGPQGLMPPPPGGGAPMPQGGPPMPQQMPPQMQGPPQGPQQAPQGPPGGPQGQPPIAPYRTLQGASQPPQQGPQGIPPPPQQQQQPPRPNSMTLQDAAQFIKAQGITDPLVGVQILDRLQPYLTQQAQVQANQLKQQQLQQDKENALRERAREADQRSKDYNLSVQERKDAAKEATETRKLLGLGMQAIAQQRVNNQTQSLQQKAAANALSPDDLRFMAEQYWAGDKTVLSGLARNPQALSAARHAIVQYGREQGKGGADVAQATAEFEGLKAGERALGTRTANVGLAVNEANALSNLALKTSEEWQRSGVKSLNDLQKYAQSKTASPELRKFVAANNSFINAYARAISPSGTPTVADKDHAREMLDTGFSKGDYAATIDILRQEMDAARTAPQATKEELRKLARADASISAPPKPAAPSVGTVQGGYRFKGGDPAKQSNWEKV
jgi:hypothetical protein